MTGEKILIGVVSAIGFILLIPLFIVYIATWPIQRLFEKRSLE